jgi:hypothetical protein
MEEQNQGDKKDRLDEIKQEIAKFSQQVNEYMKGGRRDVPRVTSQNELAILRHARAIVDDQLRSPPDDESYKKLLRLKKELDERIDLLAEALGNKEQAIVYSPKASMTGKEKAAIAGLAIAGLSLMAFAAYLAYRGQSSEEIN